MRGRNRTGRDWAIISAVATADQVSAVLRTTWHRVADQCVAGPARVGVADWVVAVGTESYVAKVVAAGQRPAFEAGLAVAEFLTTYGPAATAVRTVDGGLLGTV